MIATHNDASTASKIARARGEKNAPCSPVRNRIGVIVSASTKVA